MKKFYLSVTLLLASCLFFTGCATFDWWDDMFDSSPQHKQEKLLSNIKETKKDLYIEKAGQQQEASAMVYATGVAIDKIPEAKKTVQSSVAKEMNERAQLILGMPSSEQALAVQKLVEDLTSENEKMRIEAKKHLAERDVAIAESQKKEAELRAQLNEQEAKYKDFSKGVVTQLGEANGKLNQMDSWFGLGAVWYGMKSFVKHILWGLVIFGFIFLVLRVLAASNPIAGAVFSVFEAMAGYTMKLFLWLVPKATKFSGHTCANSFDIVRKTRDTMVTHIERMKDKQDKTGIECKLNDLIEEFRDQMDKDEKAEIKFAKQKLGL